MDHFEKLEEYVNEGKIPAHLALLIRKFFNSYDLAVVENGYAIKNLQPILDQFLQIVDEQIAHPYAFPPFHKRLHQPFDYYRIGLDLLRPLVIFQQSRVLGLEYIKEIEQVIRKGENVILLANHQTEPDPQAISLLLENSHPLLAKEMIFVAGDRVITDPLAAPFSKGRNLLCIYSKRHIDSVPELKQSKLHHNQKVMKLVRELLSEGGKCIYVAPSGGRDRPNAKGELEVAPFDPQSIEMFWIISQKSEKPTHFYPLALSTYNLLPPPNSIEKELGEKRYAHCTPIHMSVSSEIDMENFPGSDTADKKEKRQKRADYIWRLVAKDYALIR
jgi:glycerol-3-phosphate O-acyltransferase